MNRIEALTAAREHVSAINAVPMKSNGYAADGWKAPTVPEVNRMIMETAEFLLAGNESAGPLQPTISPTMTLDVATSIDVAINTGHLLISSGSRLKELVAEILEKHEADA